MWLKKIKVDFRRNRFFWAMISLIFILQMITYPSIHGIGDEKLYLDVSRKVCNLDFSYFLGKCEFSVHQPLYYMILCVTSPIHNFTMGRAEIITYTFLVLTVVGWYFTIPKEWKIDKKKFALLLFANSLLWMYSVRVLLDVPLAFFLSLGIFNLYLFYNKGRKKNCYLGLLLLSLAVLTKESALAYIPIFGIWFLLNKEKDIRKYGLLLIPLIPWLLFTAYQYLSGFPIEWMFKVVFKPTTTLRFMETIPYSSLPTFVFMVGIFGTGVILVLLSWKNMKFMKKDMKRFLLFSLVLYLIWEIAYDLLLFGNLPRYHTTLMPFLTFVISSYKDKKWLYWLTLIYLVAIGFSISFYHHVETLTIWKNLIVWK